MPTRAAWILLATERFGFAAKNMQADAHRPFLRYARAFLRSSSLAPSYLFRIPRLKEGPADTLDSPT